MRSSLIHSSAACEKEARSSKQPRNSSVSLFPKSTGEGWELRTRSSDRGCNPDTAPPTQPWKSRLSQLKPNSSRTLGRPLPATLPSPNRKAGGTRGQDLRARGSWEQRKGSYSLRGLTILGDAGQVTGSKASQPVFEEFISPT